MGQAKQKREAASRSTKLWNMKTLLAVLPPGSKPHATRYDPQLGGCWVACEDGQVHFVEWHKLEESEKKNPDMPPNGGLIIPGAPSYTEQQRQADQRYALEMKLRQDQQEKQQKQQREQQQQQKQPPPQHPKGTEHDDKDWETAMGRCAELEAHLGKALLCGCVNGRALSCHGEGGLDDAWTICKNSAMYAYIGGSVRYGRERVACPLCMEALVKSGRADLDCEQ
jgi:hypothetical protein